MSESVKRPPRARSQIRTAAIVIYATLAIVSLCIPRGVSDWVAQLGSEHAREVLLPVANCVHWVSTLSGAYRPYAVARKLFLSMSGKEEIDDVVEH
jgi:hypothetical protein